MKKIIQRKILKYKNLSYQKTKGELLSSIYKKYSQHTMIEEVIYIDNLLLAERVKHIKGCIIECGVWRGGMTAGIAEIIGKEHSYYLFDSFEGLPEAKEIDGQSAIAWQANTVGYNYYDNCKAEIEFAEKIMSKTGVDYKCIKGWFNQTIPLFDNTNGIALLRLDGDWYDSTMICLKYLFPKVLKGGMVILDDYYTWDGCSRAVHDYLSEIKTSSRIYTSTKGVCYILKAD